MGGLGTGLQLSQQQTGLGLGGLSQARCKWTIHCVLVLLICGQFLVRVHLLPCLCIIGVSLSEPHTYRYYKKIAVPMYVCVCLYL